jgi:WD40 repeat protein
MPLLFSPDGKTLVVGAPIASGASDDTVRIWDWNENKEVSHTGARCRCLIRPGWCWASQARPTLRPNVGRIGNPSYIRV